jgi:hypothetical protein
VCVCVCCPVKEVSHSHTHAHTYRVVCPGEALSTTAMKLLASVTLPGDAVPTLRSYNVGVTGKLKTISELSDFLKQQMLERGYAPERVRVCMSGWALVGGREPPAGVCGEQRGADMIGCIVQRGRDGELEFVSARLTGGGQYSSSCIGGSPLAAIALVQDLTEEVVPLVIVVKVVRTLAGAAMHTPSAAMHTPCAACIPHACSGAGTDGQVLGMPLRTQTGAP